MDNATSAFIKIKTLNSSPSIYWGDKQKIRWTKQYKDGIIGKVAAQKKWGYDSIIIETKKTIRYWPIVPIPISKTILETERKILPFLIASTAQAPKSKKQGIIDYSSDPFHNAESDTSPHIIALINHKRLENWIYNGFTKKDYFGGFITAKSPDIKDPLGELVPDLFLPMFDTTGTTWQEARDKIVGYAKEHLAMGLRALLDRSLSLPGSLQYEVEIIGG